MGGVKRMDFVTVKDDVCTISIPSVTGEILYYVTAHTDQQYSITYNIDKEIEYKSPGSTIDAGDVFSLNLYHKKRTFGVTLMMGGEDVTAEYAFTKDRYYWNIKTAGVSGDIVVTTQYD